MRNCSKESNISLISFSLHRQQRRFNTFFLLCHTPSFPFRNRSPTSSSSHTHNTYMIAFHLRFHSSTIFLYLRSYPSHLKLITSHSLQQEMGEKKKTVQTSTGSLKSHPNSTCKQAQVEAGGGGVWERASVCPRRSPSPPADLGNAHRMGTGGHGGTAGKKE